MLVELAKLGREARAYLFIQLANFQGYFLVLLVTEVEFRFALISVQELESSPTSDLVLQDIGWLDVQRIHGNEVVVKEQLDPEGPQPPKPTGTGSLGGFGPFNINLGVDRYAVCFYALNFPLI